MAKINTRKNFNYPKNLGLLLQLFLSWQDYY